MCICVFLHLCPVFALPDHVGATLSWWSMRWHCQRVVSALYCSYYPVRLPAAGPMTSCLPHSQLRVDIYVRCVISIRVNTRSGCSISNMWSQHKVAIFNVTTHVSINRPTPIQVDYRGLPKYVSHFRELMGESEWFLSLFFLYVCLHCMLRGEWAALAWHATTVPLWQEGE